MATIVHTRNRHAQLGERVGLAFGEGLDEGFDERRSQRAAQQRSEALGDLFEEVKDASSSQEAMSLLSLPKYSGLFTTLEEIKSFGEIVNDVHKPGGSDLEKIDVSVGGRQRTAFVSQEDLKEIGNDDAKLSEFLNVEGASFFEPEKDLADDFTSIINPKDPTQEKRVPTAEFNRDPDKFLKGGKFVTQENFDNIIQLRTANKGEGGSESKKEFELRAQGILERRGLEVNDKNMASAIAIRDRSDAFAPRLATAFRMQKSEEGFIEQFEGSGDSDRFTAATAVMPDLMFAGLTDTQAFKAARKIGQAITVQMRIPNGDGTFTEQTRPPDIEVQEVNSKSPSFVDLANSLDPRTDKGKIFKEGNRFLVYVGIVDGEPAFEVVEV